MRQKLWEENRYKIFESRQVFFLSCKILSGKNTEVVPQGDKFFFLLFLICFDFQRQSLFLVFSKNCRICRPDVTPPPTENGRRYGASPST